MVSSNDLIARLAQIIKNKERHPDYKRVCDLSQLYTRLVTGEDMQPLMRQFTRRENEEQFRQRVDITQHITKTVSQNIIEPFYKVPRSNSVQRNITYGDNDPEKLKSLNDKLNTFWGDESLDGFMNNRWIEMNFVDPNAFIVVEWKPFDNTVERASPYPFEVSSQEAIMFEYFNKKLVYLSTLTSQTDLITENNIDKVVMYNVYTIYGINQTVQFSEIYVKENLQTAQNAFINSVDRTFIAGYFYDKSSDKYYTITVFDAHNLGYVPAKVIGFKRDLFTKGRTYVSPIDKGIPLLMKMIKANSELDLSMALHAFPQKIQYARRCAARDCQGGITINGEICGACHGSGFETIISAQEVITIAMPKSKDDAFDLTNMVHYDYPPVDLLKFQDDYITGLTQQIKMSIFSSEIYNKQEVAETATGKNIDLQNIYDSLYPVAMAYSKSWKFYLTTIADIIQLSDGLVAFYNFSKDFKMKSLTDLYSDLKLVGDAKADEFIKQTIQDDIAGIIYSEDDHELLKYNVKKSWYPFNGKTTDQINAIVTATGMVTEFTKVFWANFGFIFDLIELDQIALKIDFYNLTRDKQWAIIQQYVQKIISQVKVEAPVNPFVTPTNQVKTTTPINKNQQS